MFAPAVLESSGELITYCTIGGRAATAWFVLTRLMGRTGAGSTTRSWAEWAASPAPPSSVRTHHLTSPHHAQKQSGGSGRLDRV